MPRVVIVSGLALAAALGLLTSLQPTLVVSPSDVQGTLQTVRLVNGKAQAAEPALRASRIVGRTVVNEASEPIARIDDLILGRNGAAPIAVLSIERVLGLSNRLVLVPYRNLKRAGDGFVLPNDAMNLLKELDE
ncbi:MAG: PRC-barrel domain containing protein [Alphaproteobacteria bacterium]|nr:PRC-barrel domain containing protein [Alphaproteobacteria bacterium]